MSLPIAPSKNSAMRDAPKAAHSWEYVKFLVSREATFLWQVSNMTCCSPSKVKKYNISCFSGQKVRK